MNYEVTLYTGNRPDAESDGHVGIRIVGRTNALADQSLQHHGRTRFRPGSKDVFTLESDDLGELSYLELYVVGKPWFLDRAVVRELPSGREFVFPHYAFVTAARAVVFEGTATLPQNDPPEVAAVRKDELATRRIVYEYVVPSNGLPAMLKEQNLELLPPDEQFSKTRTDEFEAEKHKAEWNAKLAFVRHFFDRWDAPGSEEHLYPLLHRPDVSATYAQDAELAWQTVAGVAPNHVRLSRGPAKLPAIWKGAEAELAAALGVTLAELAARELYFLDDSILEGLPMFESGAERRYAPAGSCLFVAEAPADGGEGARRPQGLALVPKAIRLVAGGPIFTPADGDSWLLAKTYVRTAEANIHQVVTHAVRTHLAIEPYLLAAMRCLSSKHPLYKLLRRHFRGTIRINAEARQLLLASGGVFDEFIALGGPKQGHLKLAAKAYEAFQLRDNHPEHDLVARGFDRPTQIAIDYPFADAALDIYLKIAEYVQATLALYYPDAASLANDTELQGFLGELRAYAHVGDLADPSGFDVAKLREILALVIYTGSVLHAGVNFQQYDHFGFVPNAPASLRTAPPEAARPSVPNEEWMRTLPNFKQSLRQLTVSYSLSRKLEDDEYLLPRDGKWREAYFVDAASTAVIDRFHDALRATKQRIETKNEARGRAYACLLPDEIPSSTTI